MPNPDFLENYPLYRKFQTKLPLWLSDLPKPAIHMPCWVCKSEQTFNMVNNYQENFGNDQLIEATGKVVRALYRCSACNGFFRFFFILTDPEGSYIIKVGQHPSWEISMDRNLEKMLGAHSEYYKKGLICESQGYGIGTFSYYRRIVEEIIDQLLIDITDLITEEEHKNYIRALEEVKKTIVAQDKIKLVKDLLPSTLRPGGINPLSVLHDILSKGLHSQNDEECMELAMTIREPLVFLVNEVIARKSSAKNFTVGMRKLLEKKTD